MSGITSNCASNLRQLWRAMDSKWKVAVSRRSYPNGSNFEWHLRKSSDFRRALVSCRGPSFLRFPGIILRQFFWNFRLFERFQIKVLFISSDSYMFVTSQPTLILDPAMILNLMFQMSVIPREAPILPLKPKLEYFTASWSIFRFILGRPSPFPNTLSYSHSPSLEWKCEQPFAKISRFNVDVPAARPERVSSKTRHKKLIMNK